MTDIRYKSAHPEDPTMSAIIHQRLLILVLLAAAATPARAADLVALSPQTFDRYIPQGKEVDGIYGDFVLANDQIVAVIAHPRARPQRQHDRPRTWAAALST